MKHDIAAVHVFIKHTIQFLKINFPGKKKVVFFTDGCGGQYKCCTNFLLLCEFEFLYGLEVEWVFFATLHGKSPCDAIGGTLKRNAAKESLRRANDNQILNVFDLQKYCEENLFSIFTVLINKEEIESQREIESKSAQTVPGTRSYHHFIPFLRP